MNCPRCKKDFPTERTSFFNRLETSGLDALQTTYVTCCYGRPLCNECLKIIKSGFYTCEVSPHLRPNKTDRQTPKSK